ncbi:MAG: RNA methyltransferase [Bacteroidales bacterium]|nr:RNA methyltransferase [Bacteroidales bacterium]
MPISNSEIKMVRALGTKKFRDESGLFVVEGEKMVAEALSSGFEPVHLWKRDDIGEEAMSRISSLSSPSPVLAVLRQRPAEEPEIKDALYLGLDSVRDPGNMGTILRLCDWFGAEGVFASRDSVELYNPKVVQATMGAIFRKKVWYCDLPDVCARFRARGLKVYGTFLDGADIYREELAAGGLVIMGNEARGISAPVAAEVDSRLYIPSFSEGPGAESLNVAVATAVCLSEFKRRTH